MAPALLFESAQGEPTTAPSLPHRRRSSSNEGQHPGFETSSSGAAASPPAVSDAPALLCEAEFGNFDLIDIDLHAWHPSGEAVSSSSVLIRAFLSAVPSGFASSHSTLDLEHYITDEGLSISAMVRLPIGSVSFALASFIQHSVHALLPDLCLKALTPSCCFNQILPALMMHRGALQGFDRTLGVSRR